MVRARYSRGAARRDPLSGNRPAGQAPSATGSEQVLGRFFGFLMAALIVVSLGGAIFLAYWDIPAPTSTVEKVLPNDRFPD